MTLFDFVELQATDKTTPTTAAFAQRFVFIFILFSFGRADATGQRRSQLRDLRNDAGRETRAGEGVPSPLRPGRGRNVTEKAHAARGNRRNG
jgi:hypothetical protein